MMKIAISGKGGVGKSTLAAALALLLAKRGNRVLLVDADPDGNLASALGIAPEEQKRIVPISQQKALIEERTGAKVKQYGQMFKLNPEVSDLAGTCAYSHRGVSLLVLGAIESGGSGCACPESVLLKALVQDLVLHKDEALIMDMEAGIEHLGRATARGVGVMLVVVEPGQRSVDSARRVIRMAGEIGLGCIQLVANKVASPADEKFIRDSFRDSDFIGTIPFSESLRSADREGRAVVDGMEPEMIKRFEEILKRLEAGG
jgi:CO dehydrogenase maturation factor